MTEKIFEDIALVWIDLSFCGTPLLSFKPKEILNNLNGYIKFGAMTALMGPSGCGKSTFLKCINGQNGEGLSKETEIYINQTKELRPCFIVQEVADHLLMGL